MKKLGLIGFGKLGKRIAYRWKETGLDPLIFDPMMSPGDNEAFSFAASIGEIVESCELIYLVVPPNAVKEVLQSCVMIDEDRQYIRAAAGVGLEELFEKSSNLARIMVSTLCQTGNSMIYLAGSIRKKTEKSLMESLSALGEVNQQKDDSRFDLLTAATACAPAYFFHTADAFAEACLALGIPRKEAIVMLKHLLSGVANSLDRDPVELRNEVLTPGGATIAGLKEFHNQGSLYELWHNALKSAQDKCLGLK